MKKSKSVVCVYLPDALMARARIISQEIGVSVSHLASVGLTQQVEKYEAVVKLMGTRVNG